MFLEENVSEEVSKTLAKEVGAKVEKNLYFNQFGRKQRIHRNNAI